MEDIIKYWETDTRYYMAELVKDLLGDWTIYCNWGGKLNRRRGGKPIICSSYDDGLMKLGTLEKKRINRKYKEITR
jgi:hypothetical protein